MNPRPTAARPSRSGGRILLPPELVIGLEKLIRATVRAELQASQAGADSWIPHPRWPCSSRRAAVVLARSGALEGVRKVGKLFLVRQSTLDAWIDGQRLERAADPAADEFEAAMARAGLRKGAARNAGDRT